MLHCFIPLMEAVSPFCPSACIDQAVFSLSCHQPKLELRLLTSVPCAAQVAMHGTGEAFLPRLEVLIVCYVDMYTDEMPMLIR